MTAPLRVAVTMTQLAHRVPGGTATSIEHLVAALGRTDGIAAVPVLARGDLRRPGTLFAATPAGSVRLPLPVPVLYDAWSRTGRPSVTRSSGDVDLVHVTVPMRVGAGDAAVVATVHDLFPLTRPGDSTPRGAALMTRGLAWIRDTAELVMVPSETVAADCRDHGFEPSRVHVVPWGVDPVEVTDADRARVRRRHRLVDPYVCVVGTTEPRKNLAGVVRAMASLDRPDLTLAVVGPTGWGDDPLASATHLAGPVARTGAVPAQDLPALMADAAVVCLPSHAEGFGLGVLEAMAAGAAVVTSSGTATEEVTGDAALLVDPGDPAAIAGAIARVLDERDLAASLRRAARERSRSFTWEATAERTAELYRAVVAAGEGRPG